MMKRSLPKELFLELKAICHCNDVYKKYKGTSYLDFPVELAEALADYDYSEKKGTRIYYYLDNVITMDTYGGEIMDISIKKAEKGDVDYLYESHTCVYIPILTDYRKIIYIINNINMGYGKRYGLAKDTSYLGVIYYLMKHGEIEEVDLNQSADVFLENIGWKRRGHICTDSYAFTGDDNKAHKCIMLTNTEELCEEV